MPSPLRLAAACLCLVALSLASAQPETLNLEFGGDIYLSHVSVGLDALPAYKQHAVVRVTRLDAQGTATETVTEEGRARAANGDVSSFSRHDVAPGMTMHSERYVMAGAGYVIGGMNGELTCAVTPAEVAAPEPLETHVADVTGFKSATLAAAGESVNGVLVDRYSLDDPPFAGNFESGSLEGTLWIARDGGYIVKYEITGIDSAGVTTTWLYDLTDVGAVTELEVPALCATP